MRWFALFIALTVGCASAISFPAPPVPETPEIWIRGTEASDTLICVELFEPNSLYAFRCLSVRSLRIMINGMSGAD